jgi:hypothetical protein
MDSNTSKVTLLFMYFTPANEVHRMHEAEEVMQTLGGGRTTQPKRATRSVGILIGIMRKLVTARRRRLENPHRLPSVKMKLNLTM